MPDDPEMTPRPGVSLTALTLEDTARLLTRVGGQPVGVELLRADVEAGATTNADGTINLVHFAAWLLKEMGRGD